MRTEWLASPKLDRTATDPFPSAEDGMRGGREEMSEERITRVSLKQARKMKGETDWARVEALTDEDIERAAAVQRDFSELGGFPPCGRILVLVGEGHNGGDALLATQRLLEAFPGTTAEVIFASDLLKVRYSPQHLPVERIVERVQSLGYRAGEHSGQRGVVCLFLACCLTCNITGAPKYPHRRASCRTLVADRSMR